MAAMLEDTTSIMAALRQARSELRLVTAALLTAQEMERKRIAGELHDSIGQAFGTIGISVATAIELVRNGDARAAETILMDVAGQTRSAISEVRRIALNLRPETLDSLGIVATLSWYFREFRKVHPQLEVITDIDISTAEVSPCLATAIFRVVQEATSNIVRHSGASRISVILRHRNAMLQLRVEDNGCGMGRADPLPDCHHGMGLRGMHDRVEFSGGRFHLESDPGAGTRIGADWPLAGRAAPVRATPRLYRTTSSATA